MEYRKRIEKDMERFKMCERETKTKAFSKEGLQVPTKTDPKEKEKSVVRDWIGNVVGDLTKQIEMSEAEIETLSTKKKLKAADKVTMGEIQQYVDRCKWHQTKLELVLRRMENDVLAPEDINPVREDVEYFVESKDDWDENFGDEAFYDDLNLDDDDDDAAAGTTSTKPAVESSTTTTHAAPTPASIAAAAAAAEASPLSMGVVAPSKPAPTTTNGVPAAIAATSTGAVAAKGVKKGASAPAATGKAAPGLAGASPASGGQGLLGAGRGAAGVLPRPAGRGGFLAAATGATGPGKQVNVMPSANKGGAGPGILGGQPSNVPSMVGGVKGGEEGKAGSKSTAPPPSAAGPNSVPYAERLKAGLANKGASALPTATANANAAAAAAAANAAASASGQPQSQAQAQQPAAGPATGVGSPPRPNGPASGPGTPPGLAGPTPAGVKGAAPPGTTPGIGRGGQMKQAAAAAAAASQDAAAAAAAPSSAPGRTLSMGSLGGYVSVPSTGDSTKGLEDLKAASRYMPEPADADRSRYVPRNPFATPAYYPKTPAPVFENPLLFEKLGIDTLFFAFYYQQGTYQQYLAARDLKRQSWRYHKKYLTWFQRHEEPKVIGDEYEQGTYVYFDYESAWCQRKKAEFTFEYRYLEDELGNQ